MTEETKTPEGEQNGAPKTFTEEQVRELLEKETSGLKSKLDELLSEAKTAKQKAKEEAKAREEAAAEAARKAGDVEALEKSWQEKLAKTAAEKDEQLQSLQKTVETLTVGAAAKDLAAELAVQGSAPVLERIVRDRLTVEMTEEGPKVRVTDASGKPSAATLEDLKQELTNDPALKPLIVGSKATGGGAAGAGGGAAVKKFSEMTGTEKVQLRRTNPQEYDRLKAAG